MQSWRERKDTSCIVTHEITGGCIPSKQESKLRRERARKLEIQVEKVSLGMVARDDLQLTAASQPSDENGTRKKFQ